MAGAGRHRAERRAQSLQDGAHLTHSWSLRAACERAGVRDPDDLWDHLFEVDHDKLDTPTFVRNVFGYCALSRIDATDESLEAEGTLARERAMAAAIAEGKGKVVVVTGGVQPDAAAETK